MATVSARIDDVLKTTAESYLAQNGISRTAAIEMFYRQIIMHRGLPFAATLPSTWVPSLDTMTEEDFDRIMSAGIAQAQAGESYDAEEVFNDILSRL